MTHFLLRDRRSTWHNDRSSVLDKEESQQGPRSLYTSRTARDCRASIAGKVASTAAHGRYVSRVTRPEPGEGEW